MSYSLQNASKLFVKIPASVGSLFHNSSWKNYFYVQDHDGISVEDEKTVVLWTSKLSNFVRKNKPLNAIGLFKEMLVNNQKPNFVTLLSIIRAIGQLESGNMASMMHGYAIKTGFDSEVSVVTALLGVYSVWNISAMGLLFNQTPRKDVVLWSSMVSVCVKNEEYGKAFEFFRKMQFSGVQPNYVTIVSVLPACADLGALPLGKEIHGFSIKNGFNSQINVQNSLVDMYSKCRNFKYSSRIFNRMQLKDQISWRSMIYGCIENEYPGKALGMFSEMRLSGLEPDENIMRDIVVVVSSQFGQLDHGLGLQALALKGGHLAAVSMVTAFLQMYSKFDQLESARILFDSLKYKDLIAWSAMISAYTQNGQSSNAFNIFREMQMTEENPNEVTFVSLLQSCSLMASSEIGESIHAHVIKAGYMSNAFLISALIDMYCKFGRIRQGESLFDENHANDLICWSSMINGYGINGFGDEALACFSDMILSGIKPNNVVFISVLSACSHCGLEYEGWNWFKSMEEKYALTPKLAHYACMVDMLSRQGNIGEALEFVKSMPIEPDKRIWGTLLSGCRKTYGCSEILEFVAKQLISLDPKDSSYYVILSNLYAEQGRWIEVEKLREFTDAKGLKKERGYSMI